MIKNDDAARRRAAAISAVVYGEQDADYWYRYFNIQKQTDKQGIEVELGGSSVNNLADNLNLFGLAPGSTNVFAATYTVFGNIVKSQYPDLVPSFPSVNEVVDLSFIKELNTAAPPTSQPDLPRFEAVAKPVATKEVISRRTWDIQFASGKAAFTPMAQATLKQLLDDLVIAGGTTVEVHGHTDNQGNVDRNMQLSEDRAFAVKTWLEQQSPANFPAGRVRVFAYGPTQPVAPNGTAEGRAKNRRVEIVLGANE
jgi:outer membrane protein OmpA-like peptidoglycan-associated protein